MQPSSSAQGRTMSALCRPLPWLPISVLGLLASTGLLRRPPLAPSQEPCLVLSPLKQCVDQRGEGGAAPHPVPDPSVPDPSVPPKCSGRNGLSRALLATRRVKRSIMFVPKVSARQAPFVQPSKTIEDMVRKVLDKWKANPWRCGESRPRPLGCLPPSQPRTSHSILHPS